MATVDLKARQGNTTRKLTLTRDALPSFSTLHGLISSRFHRDPSSFTLAFVDQDGDSITVSSDEELLELVWPRLDTTTGKLPILHLVDTERVRNEVATVAASSTATSSSTAASDSTSEVARELDEWCDVTAAEGEAVTPVERNEHENEPSMPPVLLFDHDLDAQDPAEPVLSPDTPSTAERATSLAASEFPFSSEASSNAQHQVFPDDPDDAPLPGSFASPPSGASENTSPPFVSLPSALGSLLSALPASATSFTSTLSHLAAAPDTALGRLTALVSPSDPTPWLSPDRSPADLSLADVARALSTLGADVGSAVQEVVQGVRREADQVRAEFEAFRQECDREGRRFEEEVRSAVEEVKRQYAQQGGQQARETASDPPTPPPAAEAPLPDAVEEKDEGVAPAATAPPAQLSEAERLRLLQTRQAKRVAKEARQIVKEKRRQEKEARREARKEEKEKRREEREVKRAEKGKKREEAYVVEEPKEQEETQEMDGSTVSLGSTVAEVESPPAAGSSTMPGALPAPLSLSPSHPLSPSARLPSPPLSPSYLSANPTSPILLTQFLLVCRDTLGLEIEKSAEVREALTSIWCEANGRGVEGMVERAVEELL
ncbi:hypothetical protein JCM8097_004015 [Rhodosporidiobolus ruineniae]